MCAPTLYFAYGSNLSEDGMRVRCPTARSQSPARLDGWRLTFRGVADIAPEPGRTVHGALWLLRAADIDALDAYEGALTFYGHRTVEVDTDDGQRSAMTYVMRRPTYLGLPSDWYFDSIEQGYRRWGLPVDELHRALDESRQELDRRGVKRFEPDGRKRLRAIIADMRSIEAD